LATNSKLAKSAASGFPWNRLWFLLGALVVFRLGSHIPVPGIDHHATDDRRQPAAGAVEEGR
jgi:preprotein translocase subunit SecY